MTFLAILTPEAEKWATDNLNTESWQTQGDVIAIDHRYIEDIINGMVESGLKTQVDFTIY